MYFTVTIIVSFCLILSSYGHYPGGEINTFDVFNKIRYLSELNSEPIQDLNELAKIYGEEKLSSNIDLIEARIKLLSSFEPVPQFGGGKAIAIHAHSDNFHQILVKKADGELVIYDFPAKLIQTKGKNFPDLEILFSHDHDIQKEPEIQKGVNTPTGSLKTVSEDVDKVNESGSNKRKTFTWSILLLLVILYLFRLIKVSSKKGLKEE